MKYIVLDSGAIISLAMNNLLWTLEELKKKTKIEFIIPYSVKKEIVDKPMRSKKYKLEAIQIKSLISNSIIREEKRREVKKYLFACNNLFYVHNTPLRILQEAELEALILARDLNGGYVVDERTMRVLVESPEQLKKILENKLKAEVTINNKNLDLLKSEICCVPIIRSTELMYMAYEKGVFKDLLKGTTKKEFLDGLLWGLRLRGCSISTEEIKKLISLS